MTRQQKIRSRQFVNPERIIQVRQDSTVIILESTHYTYVVKEIKARIRQPACIMACNNA
jgi:hypothetical protein